MSKNIHRKGRLPLWGQLTLVALLVAVVAIWFFFFKSMTSKSHIVFVNSSDSPESIIEKVGEGSSSPQYAAFKLLVGMTGKENIVHEGRYDVGLKSAFGVFRALYGGHQTPVHLTIPSVRTLGDMADVVCKKVRFKKEEFMAAVEDAAFTDSLGYNPQTIIGAFTPNTYDIYWCISPRDFLKKMVAESDKFWTKERLAKAEADSLSRMQVIILASIIQEETNIAKDKPIIAGLYINRLRIGMRLQSCPTIRFALGDFTINRLYENMLQTDNPYNTYRNPGLPPGPIRNPNPEDIDAVLDYDHNDYLYMCASAKLDGTHHFTKTYEEHKAYSVEYDKELNRRQIK